MRELRRERAGKKRRSGCKTTSYNASHTGHDTEAAAHSWSSALIRDARNNTCKHKSPVGSETTCNFGNGTKQDQAQINRGEEEVIDANFLLKNRLNEGGGGEKFEKEIWPSQEIRRHFVFLLLRDTNEGHSHQSIGR